MATKTFKIGLSNTDKQNMAQEVYERLLALTFPEYDTTTSYDVGDFVVYNDQLYKCIGATSGAWDSSKWQLATLNDLLTDIEDAVQFVNDKANVDGNYPTMTVGVADQLSPYDDESGDDQEEPFSFQATGTGNGTQPDFSTGAIALMKEKQGNTVVVNQLGRHVSGSESYITWNGHIGTLHIDNSEGSSTTYASIISINVITGHKYLFLPTISNNGNCYVYLTASNQAELVNGGITEAVLTGEYPINIGVGAGKVAEMVFYDYVIDLTQWFNGDIPQDLLDHPENFFHYYQGSLAYNQGTLVNANSRYLKAIGRNQWDEEYGEYHWIGGTRQAYSGGFGCKNPIRVIPNATYYFKRPAVVAGFVFLDKDNNLVGARENYLNTTDHRFTVPSNAMYMCFWLNNYGTTYNNDITISIYYTGEGGYDKYYPYELLTDNDTGVEVLRSAGNAYDVKKPDGEIKRNIFLSQNAEDMGLNRVGLDGGDTIFVFIYSYYSIYGSNDVIKKPLNNDGKANALFNGLICVTRNRMYLQDKCFSIQTDGQIIIRDDSCLTASDFTTKYAGQQFYLELETPTTEQGTPYSENVAIDDFGSMSFEGTSGVPQGNALFYPVDYKAFIDTLYDYTEGTPSNLALKSDLTVVNNKIGAKLPECPTTTDGTYALKATVSDGEVVYTWESEA